ncbi:MAG: aminoacyl-tRNA hydrolase [Candidatus Dependentiae bacterium]|jgi:PTH1 family peptidyl-tRNA hydrolase
MSTPKYEIQSIRVIVGLGNPGGKFELTRHNAGFLVVDHLADTYGGRWSNAGSIKECLITIPLADDESHQLHLIKPQAYMNKSGHVIRHLKKESIEPSQIVVVHDELEKKFGSVTKRLGGSARGHNGLKSIIEFFGFDFWRVRVGIGRPERGTVEVSDYVLSRFSDEELDALGEIVKSGSEAVLK